MTLYKGAKLHMVNKDKALETGGHVLYEVEEYSYITGDRLMVILRIIE